MTHVVTFAPAAERHLLEIYEWISDASAPEAVERFVSSIIDYCKRLADTPMIGTAREDLRLELRTVGFCRRAVIAFQAAGARIAILRVLYGGQAYDARLAAEG